MSNEYKVIDLEKAYLNANARRIESRARQMRAAIRSWLRRRAIMEADKLLNQFQEGKLRVRKARDDEKMLEELKRILVMFGVRQINNTGKRTTRYLESDWILKPGLLDEIIRNKTVLVQNINRETIVQVRQALSDIIRSAKAEVPRPSVGEIAARIRNQFHNTKPNALKVPYVFSPERAMLIARTESVQNENTAIVEGMKVAGVEYIEWIAVRDGKSGDRAHDEMHGERVKVGEKFKMKGKWKDELRYPGDPSAPIRQTANCRCSVKPYIERKQKAA